MLKKEKRKKKKKMVTTGSAKPGFIINVIKGVVTGQEVNPLGGVDFLVKLVFNEVPL